jgi:hypothetical protein
MMHIRRFQWFFRTVRAWMPLVLEAALTLASVRMAVLLFTDQGYFEKYRAFYIWLLTYLPNAEWKWGLLAATAAALKAFGMVFMAFRRSDRAQDVAFILRGLGWVLSVIFWSTFSLSIQLGDAWSLGAITSGALAQLSLAALVMGPAMPEEAHAGYQG